MTTTQQIDLVLLPDGTCEIHLDPMTTVYCDSPQQAEEFLDFLEQRTRANSR